ncbi:MAG: hypothetical protein HZB92_07170 [Euryarchaeota archaeon]|nr:hypothetical protein [Euryarchaeota archaeon]
MAKQKSDAEDEKEGVLFLTKGSKYRISSLESRDHPLVTNGTFMGYTAIGHDEGICVQLDDTHKGDVGIMRVIPTHMIISIDVIQAAKPKEQKAPDTATMFG